MRLLVTGRDGQVAQALLALSGSDVEVVALGRPTLDLTDRASIERAIAEHRPDVVVNAAAYTAVDKAESDEAAAYAVNAEGAGHVAAAAAAAGLPVVHISTDYVFAGDKADPMSRAIRPDRKAPTAAPSSKASGWSHRPIRTTRSCARPGSTVPMARTS